MHQGRAASAGCGFFINDILDPASLAVQIVGCVGQPSFSTGCRTILPFNIQ